MNEEESILSVYPTGKEESLVSNMNVFGLSSVSGSVGGEVELKDSTQILEETDLPNLAKDFGRDDDTILACYRGTLNNPWFYW